MGKYIFRSKTFNELYAANSWWLVNVAGSPSDHSARKLSEKLDDILIDLEGSEHNLKVLNQKVQQLINIQKDLSGLIQSNKNWKNLSDPEEEHRRQFFDFLNEVLATRILKNKGFTRIQLIEDEKKEKKKIADIIAEKDKNKYVIEVKTIQRPREEDDALRISYYGSMVNPNFRISLEKKLRKILKDAQEKFVNYPEDQKLTMVFYNPGINASLVIKNSISEKVSLEDIFDPIYFQNLEKEFEMQIWNEIGQFD